MKMSKLLFAAAVFLMSNINADLETLRRDLHFCVYDEITYKYEFNTSDYWISIGRVQALSHAIYLIDCEILGIE